MKCICQNKSHRNKHPLLERFVKYTEINEWKIRKNEDLESLFWKPIIVEAIKVRHYNEQSMSREFKTHYFVQSWKGTRKRKKYLGRLRMKKNMEELRGGLD